MDNPIKRAYQLLLLLGFISLLGDIIYEGGRSVNGQYLNILGVNAATVGIIIGLGELLGYLFRLLSGYLADRTKSYWLFTIVGYGLLLSVPLIALTNSWQIVAFLIVMERIGKGIRTPARDTITSHAAKRVGTGYGFGIAEFIDQIGAIGGPLIFTLIFVNVANGLDLINAYKQGYNFFWIPFSLLLFVLFFTYFKFKDSEALERSLHYCKSNVKLTKHFWLYIYFVFITTIGYVNFALIGFHLKNLGILSDSYIPLLYASAMGIDAIAGIWSGKVYDRLKKSTKVRQEYYLLLVIPTVATFIPFLVFSNSLTLVILGTILFGIGMGVQETVMKAVVADMTPMSRRSSGYGLFNLSFGLAFFIGNAIAGYLYDYSVAVLMIILALIEISSIPVFFIMKKAE
ncbi:MAG: MFS transporter [Thermodesulfovibrionales bacterium]|nr:MFS transporter [Thermodesulfovibrionales bacterium]